LDYLHGSTSGKYEEQRESIGRNTVVAMALDMEQSRADAADLRSVPYEGEMKKKKTF
jgi:hypothetical protein